MSMSRRRFVRNLSSASLAGSFLPWHLSEASEKPDHKSPGHDRNPFLLGNYAPVREEIQADNLKVIGRVPAEMDGMFLRNGPNPQFLPKGPYHWFDGDGMLHGVRIRDGKASYRNRYVHTAGWMEEKKAGHSLYDGLLCPPDYLRIARGEEGYKNAANTALVWHDNRLLALWEGGAPHQVKVPSLETVGKFNFGGKLRHNFTAHPKVDPATGEMIFFGYQPVKPYLQVSIANSRAEIVRTTPIDLPNPVMIHDFAITANYSIIPDFPVVFSFERLLKGKPVFGFEPDKGARIGLLPRHGKGNGVQWFPVETGAVFHLLNAHEANEEVVVQGCRMKELSENLEPPEQAGPERRKKMSVLYEWRLNRKTGRVKEKPLDDVPSDFPRIDDAFTGKPVGHGYTMRLAMDGYVRYDLKTGNSQTHFLGKGRLGGEGVFVRRPGGKSEEDGWLVSYVNDANTGHGEMRIVNCLDFQAEPIARILLPGRVPFGFHGIWLTGEQIGQSRG